MFFRAAGEEGDDVAFTVPSVQFLQGLGEHLGIGHAPRLLVGDVVADGAVDVDQEVLDVLRKLGAHLLAVIGSLDQTR
jgi:hypothetical protein